MRHSLLWYSMQTLRSFRASRCFGWSFTLIIRSMLNIVHSFLFTKVSFQHDIFTITWNADLYPLQDVLVGELLQQVSITHAELVAAEVLWLFFSGASVNSGTWIVENENKDKVDIIETHPPGMFTTRRELHTPDLLETSWSWDRKLEHVRTTSVHAGHTVCWQTTVRTFPTGH